MSLSSAILPWDTEGEKWAKLQRLFRQMADNAGISYVLGFPLTDIQVGDTEGVKWQKLGAWAKLIADNIGAGVPAGPITTSGLTMNTARILARTTAGVGAVEERAIGAGLTLAVGGLSVAAAQTTISSITAPTNSDLTLAALDSNKNIRLSPDGSGQVIVSTTLLVSGGAAFINGANTRWIANRAANTNYGGLALQTNGVDDWIIGYGATGGDSNLRIYGYGPNADVFAIDRTTGALSVISSFTTGAPSSGTAAAWKLGVKVNAVVVFDTAKYLQVDVGGVAYKVALAA